MVRPAKTSLYAMNRTTAPPKSTNLARFSSLASADRLAIQVADLAQPGDFWVFSGSLPPGAEPDLYARLIDLVQVRGGRAFLDSSGPALVAGLAARPFAAKPNSEEMAELLGCTIASDA